MSDTTFVNGVTLTDADWFNDVNRLHYTIFSDPADAAAVRTAVSVPSKAEIQNGTQVLLASVAGTNTITASASPAPTAYASGQAFRFIPANTNTGATTLNLNSLGAKNVYLNNAALVGGEITQNVPVVVMYDGTQFQIIGPNQPATQTQQEAGSQTNVYVTPGRQQYHPSAVKGAALCQMNGTAVWSYNVSSLGDQGAGQVVVNWDTDFSGATNYAVVATTQAESSNLLFTMIQNNGIPPSASQVLIDSVNTSGSLTDGNYIHVMAVGDQ